MPPKKRRSKLTPLFLLGALRLVDASSSSGNNGNRGSSPPPPPPDYYPPIEYDENGQPRRPPPPGQQAQDPAALQDDQDPPYYIDNHPPWEETDNDNVGYDYSTADTRSDDRGYYYDDNNYAEPPQYRPGEDPGRPDSWNTNANSAIRPPPPQRPPPAASQKYEPIHYNFPKEKEEKKRGWFGRRKRSGNNDFDTDKLGLATPKLDRDGIPETVSPIVIDRPLDDDRRRGRRDDDLPEYASARQDIVTRYRSTFNGRMALAASSGAAGSIAGAFLGKSLLNSPLTFASIGCGLFLLCTMLRNPYGELVRALGMALILALQRTTSIRRRYPTWRHVRSSLGAAPRRPFPPAANPWNYQPRDDRDVQFKMLFTFVAMAFVGSTVGGSMPLIPTWLGSLVGAGFFGFVSTLQSARGDLVRSMGMRVVALCEEMLGINSELEILSKGGVVSGKVLDKIFILDRKHRIKDRLISGATFLYRQVYNQINRAQSDAGMTPPEPRGDDRRGRPYDDDRDRRRPRDDRPYDDRDDLRRRDDRPPPSYDDRRRLDEPRGRRPDDGRGRPPAP